MPDVPYEFECDKPSGFMPNPNEHKRTGYVTALKGFGQSAPIVFKADLTVFSPYNGAAPAYGPAAALSGNSQTSLGKLNVVGVIETWKWSGAVGAPIEVVMWMSQENAVHVKSAQQSTLTTTRVDQLGYWICNFDQEKKIWYEQAYPASDVNISGLVGPQENPVLDVDLTGAPAIDGIDVMVYKVTVGVVPGANKMYALSFANSAFTPQTKSWGIVVGTLAAGQYQY